jgi:hypothetical protein
MSSQSLNTTTYAGYVSGSTKLGPIPLRDSSDLTRQIREQAIYRENKSGSVIQPGSSEHKWLMFGNQFRLSYLHGKVKCGDSSGCAFNKNGAYATIPIGATYGGS